LQDAGGDQLRVQVPIRIARLEALASLSSNPETAAPAEPKIDAQGRAYATGKRKNEFMQGLVKMLDERSRQAITHFYASTPVTPMIAPGPLAERGAALYAKNCARCHQADARGAEGFPRLAGQQQDYLRINLKRYLTQSGERLYTPMTAAVTMLGEDNFEAVTQYLTSLK